MFRRGSRTCRIRNQTPSWITTLSPTTQTDLHSPTALQNLWHGGWSVEGEGEKKATQGRHGGESRTKLNFQDQLFLQTRDTFQGRLPLLSEVHYHLVKQLLVTFECPTCAKRSGKPGANEFCYLVRALKNHMHLSGDRCSSPAKTSGKEEVTLTPAQPPAGLNFLWVLSIHSAHWLLWAWWIMGKPLTTSTRAKGKQLAKGDTNMGERGQVSRAALDRHQAVGFWKLSRVRL